MLKPLQPFLLPAVAAMMFVGGCTSAPKDLDTSLDRMTAKGAYRVALVPPPEAVAINKMHSWQVKVATPEGQPVTNAAIGVDGGMPQHGHGLPTKPRVTIELAPGTYLIEGMKFSMPGWWEIKLKLRASQGDDDITFNTVLDSSGARQ